MYIIPKKYDAAKVRLEIKKQMAADGKKAVLVPELGSLYDVALEKSGLGLGKGLGKVIMKEDFFCLLDQIKELPDKFKDNNRNYKSAIFALLNEMAFDSEDLSSYSFRSTVEAAGLNRALCTLIYKTVRDRGFLFRAQVYRKAIEEIEKSGIQPDEEYILIPGEYYTKLEQELLEKLKAKSEPAENRNQALCRAMFSDKVTGDFQIPEPEKMVGFLKADSVMEQYIAVKNHVLAMMKKDSSLRLDDFCLVLGGDDSLALCTSYYESIGFHPVSSAMVQAETPVLEGLNIISYALSGETEKLIRYYNRHHADDKVIYDPTYDFGDFWSFCKKLSQSDGTKFDKLRNVPIPFKEWIQKLSYIRKDDKVQSVAKNLDQVQRILKSLGLADESLYEYRTSPEQIFKNEEGEDRIQFKDLVEYFKNILTGRKRNMISTWDDGIVLVKMGEYIPKCRFIYFADLEEDTFLKDKMPNLLLSADEHDEFNTKVYGCTKEDHLKKCFASGISSAQRIIFVIPSYDEGTVVSEYAENALRLFPMNTRTVKIVGSKIDDFEHKFYRNFKDVEWENVEPALAPVSSGQIFDLKVKEGNPQEYVLKKLRSATKIEDFMRCPAKFIYDCQHPDAQLKDEVHFDKGKAFHLFCELFFAQRNVQTFKAIKNKDALNQEIASYIIKAPCNPDLASYLDSMEVRDIFETVCKKYPGLELKDNDFLKYLFFVLTCMKETMADCDSSSIRIEVFIGGAPLLDTPPVSVGEGYIDMMFRTNSGTVVLVDFKSGDIKDYADDVKTFSNVQLLIYSHIVQEAIKNCDFSVFQPTDEQKERMAEKGKDESSILESGYFDSVAESASVEAYYLSCKDSYGFKAVNGIKAKNPDDPQDQEPIEGFREKLERLIDQASDNEFRPSFNKECTYCPLNSFCPDRDSGQSLDDIYEKLNLQGDFLTENEYPVPPAETSAAGPAIEPVKIIQFAEPAKYSAVADAESDIIISAGAGAGKTEVLTTRYLNLLLNTDADLENILCITFTEKAAGEMKKRIFVKLRDTLSLGAFYSVPASGSSPEAYRLSEQQIQKLNKIKKNFFRNNRISTFHSFCLNMLTRFEKEDSDSLRDLTSTVAEDFVIKDKKIEIVSRLVKTYADNYSIFAKWTAFLPVYYKADEGEYGVAKDIIDLLNSIKLSGMPLTEASRDLLAQKFETRKRKAVKELAEKFEIARNILIDAIVAFKDAEILAGAKQKNIDKLDAEIDRLNRGECGSDQAYPYKQNPDLKELLKIFQSHPCPAAGENCTQEEEMALRTILFNLLLEADSRIEQYKIDNSIIELSDYHLYLLSLMEKKQILQRIKDELKYIMVDEFQDTNWLQKNILDKLHDEQNHLFVVGDLKQSIYRFQQCDNQIFKYYRDQDSMLYITFQENFRSVEQIVEFNNRYFTYNKVDEYQIIPHTSKDPGHLEMGIPMCPASEGPAVSIVELGYPTGAFNTLSKKDINALIREQEAFFIAHTIAITGKEQFGRWGILVREYTNMSYILDALRRLNIPYSFCIKKNFFRQPEIVQVLQVLQVLYGFLPQETLDSNPVLKEFVAGYKEKEKGFCYAISSIMKLPLYAPVRPMLHELMLQCQEFVRQCGESPEEVLTQLLDFADENSKEINISALENGVRIMTVHSSKGLEFDYLFVSKITDFTGKGGFGGPKPNLDFINYVDEDKNQIIDFDIAGIKTLVKDDRPMFYDAWIKEKNTEFDSEEKGNLLYVAFTRAKKHLVVTMQCSEFKGSVKADVNWLKNIRGNLPSLTDVKAYPELDISCIEPVLKKDEPDQMFPVELVELPDPELATKSVSHYLDMLEEKGDPDDKITDADADVPENTGNKASQVGTAVHSFFEKNVNDLSVAKPEDFSVSESIRSRFLTFAKAGLKVPEYQALVAGADGLLTEKAMVFHAPDGKLLNGVIDLIVRKGDNVTVLDYKTHTGDSLDEATLERYKEQVALYTHGLKAIWPECTFDGCLLVMCSTGASQLVWC